MKFGRDGGAPVRLSWSLKGDGDGGRQEKVSMAV
ncbi:hypothetical protein LINPERHAP1_LOCUS4902, partial [Linum perenne]